jgi:hypothetical protein
MSKDMHNDEFYIGYLKEAPPQTSRAMKRVVVGSVILVVCISVVLVLSQRKFATTRFEYGVYTTVEGLLFTTPIPHLVVTLGDAGGQRLVQHILLVGFGKSGAGGLMSQLGEKAGHTLDGAMVRLQGNLIYGDGKTLLQVEEETINLAIVRQTAATYRSYIGGSVVRRIQGEIVDPKCFFGVMKPAEGKPHRSCAIRCISGGIPAVFHSMSDEYFVLIDENSEPLNAEILSIVGDYVTLQGECITWGDWNILNVSKEDILALTIKRKREERVLAFETGITTCR